MDFDEVQRIWPRQAEMQDDFERLAEAGPLLGGWTGVRWDEGDIVVVVTDPDRDGSGLLALVDHPDRVRVERAPYSRHELDAVWHELRAIIDQRDEIETRPWHSMGFGFERVTIGLNADEHVLAARLHERFGDLLEIRLGALPYPLPTNAPRRRIELPKATLDPPDLELLPEPDQPSYRPGETIHGDLLFANHGPHRLVIDAFGWATGRVVDDTDAVVGVFIGARAGVGRPTLIIEPGSSDTTSFLGGTSSTDPHLGSALPPGNYRLVVTLEVRLGTHEDSPRGLLVSTAVPLAIRN